MAPNLAYRSVKREGGEAPGSKHHIRFGDGKWAGRRGMRRLNPRRETKIQGTNGDRGRGMREKSQIGEILGAQTEAARQSRVKPPVISERRIRARARGREITVATHNVQTMAVDGTHGIGQALDVLSVYGRLGCDVIGLQETRRSGHSALTQAGYLVYCSDECGGENGGKKGQGGVGLAVRTSIPRAAHPPEFISDRLLKVTLELLRGRAKTIMFFVACAPAETQNASNKHACWTTLGRAVEGVPSTYLVPRHE